MNISRHALMYSLAEMIHLFCPEHWSVTSRDCLSRICLHHYTLSPVSSQSKRQLTDVTSAVPSGIWDEGCPEHL